MKNQIKDLKKAIILLVVVVSQTSSSIDDSLGTICPSKIHVGGLIGDRINMTIDNNFFKIDHEKDFMQYFLSKQSGGITGDFVAMGMLIDAAVHFAKYRGDNTLIEAKNKLVKTIIDSQQDDGYIGYYEQNRRLWEGWDIHEIGFIITGLINDYRYFGAEKSLQAAIKAADYVLSRWHLKPDTFGNFIDEFVLLTGFDEAIFSLYKITGEPRFLYFNESLKPLNKWDPGIVIGRKVGVRGHIFAYLAVCNAQMELYRLSENTDLLNPTKSALDFLMNQNGLSIVGSAGQTEIWTDDQDGAGKLGETCATAYLIRIFNNLFRLYGKSYYGDLIERTLYNGLFAAQSPDGRQLRYYTPAEGRRIYYNHDYMCCPGNYRRIISELPELIYYTGENDKVLVNLFTESNVNMTLSEGTNLKLEQHTDYPTSGQVEFLMNLNKSHVFPFQIRIPKWAKNTRVSINGIPVDEEIQEGEFLTIKRKWNHKDKIVVSFPMEFRLIKGRQRNSGRVAVMRGPQVFCLSLSRNPELKQDVELMESKNFSKLIIDPYSLKLVSDSTVRQNAVACEIGVWKEGSHVPRPYVYKLYLTEFPDPDGIETFFRLPDYKYSIEDELAGGYTERIKP